MSDAHACGKPAYREQPSIKGCRAPAGQPSPVAQQASESRATPRQRELAWTPSKATSTTNSGRTSAAQSSWPPRPSAAARSARPAWRPTSARTSSLGTIYPVPPGSRAPNFRCSASRCRGPLGRHAQPGPGLSSGPTCRGLVEGDAAGSSPRQPRKRDCWFPPTAAMPMGRRRRRGSISERSAAGLDA